MENQKILDIEKSIKDLNIQGATNVAIATLEGVKIFIQESRIDNLEMFYNEVIEIGNRLANARENEPLARNGIKFLKYKYKNRIDELHNIEDMKQLLLEYCEQYLFMIADCKRAIIDNGISHVKYLKNVLTHCHSSTAVSVIKEIAKGKELFEVVCTETRPLMQGRISAKSFLEEGISTTLLADSAVESFIVGRGSVPIEAVFIGSDQITLSGSCINKIGSWGIAFTSYFAKKPVYVVSPLLKIEPGIKKGNIEIEVRENKELWEDAPSDLKIYNPAFEIVDSSIITAYMTEFGILHPREIADIVKIKYPWLFTS